jgi:GT2 family glycosyltransferase
MTDANTDTILMPSAQANIAAKAETTADAGAIGSFGVDSPCTDAAAESSSFSPARVVEIELTEPLPTVSYDGWHKRIWVLGRLHTEPVGTCVISLDKEEISQGQLAVKLWRELSEAVTERFAAAGLTEPASLDPAGLESNPALWPSLCERAQVLADAPFISVVICTRDRPEELATCLRRLEHQDYPNFEVVVVDNAPTVDVVRALVEDRQGQVKYRYITEPRPGLSWARNAGVASAYGDIVAFLDDDDEADRHWLTGIACGFARSERIGCVTGLILPAELDTAAQELFEQRGGHNSGRGFSKAIFSRSGPQSPLYPLPPFGTGANMAFRREALASIGGFDVALGAGTPAGAGEDTLALTLTMLSGYEIAYEPAALMWHHHRKDIKSLSHQLHGYSVGLTAFYAALLRHRPSVLPALLKLLPSAARYLGSSKATGSAEPSDAAAELKRRHVQGLLIGPLAYLRSMSMQARAASSASPAEVP